MNVQRRQALALPLALLPEVSGASRTMILCTYDVPQMKAMKGLTFPRVMLYGADGKLVPRDAWPSALTELKRAAGDAFCCVSDKPSPPGWLGPPPECRIVVYGENIDEHFVGLKSPDGRAITYAGLPAHQHLIVEYYASWCAPCLPARQALEAHLASLHGRNTVALAVDFSRLASGQ